MRWTVDVVEWLLDSDPAMRWQVMRDLIDAPDDEVAAENARVATEGWGARLSALQRQDGNWDKSIPARLTSAEAISWWKSLPPERQGTLFPEWTSTAWSLMLLRAFGLDPTGAEARQAVRRVREHVAWEHDGEPFFAGEVEPCINGNVVALGAYFGERVHRIVDRLLEYERATGGSPEVSAARLRGQEYLLERRMLRRLSTGDVIDSAFTQFSYPTYWHYDVLRGLDYMRAADAAKDERMTDAIDLVESKCDAEGRWPLENPHPGRMHFTLDEGEGRPSRWNTLRAMRVLRWYQQTPRAGSSELNRY